VAGAFPLEAPLVTTLGAGKLSSRSFLITRVARSPWEALPELEASLKSREPAVAPAPVPAAGTVAYTFNTSLGLEGVRAAGSEGSSNPARTGVSSVASIATSRVPSWLGRSEDVQAAASFPVATSSVAGGRGVAASAGVIFPAGVESTSGAATGLEIASAGTSERTGSSALVSLATGSNRGEWRSSSMRPESLPTSSLRALLWHEGSGAEITVSPEEGVGEGCVAKSTERRDLQKRRPTIESIRAAAVK
jgi:hypothetical protein